ncbi:uncharacterized protein LOC135419697 [Pseudopipra pipra]|uniref:uncharacterized protein LOC135419697 n=1 Tax=Pseudopipra pipra TaxID=415032 RepID=UPI0031397B9F
MIKASERSLNQRKTTFLSTKARIDHEIKKTERTLRREKTSPNNERTDFSGLKHKYLKSIKKKVLFSEQEQDRQFLQQKCENTQAGNGEKEGMQMVKNQPNRKAVRQHHWRKKEDPLQYMAKATGSISKPVSAESTEAEVLPVCQLRALRSYVCTSAEDKSSTLVNLSN